MNGFERPVGGGRCLLGRNLGLLCSFFGGGSASLSLLGLLDLLLDFGLRRAASE